MNKLSEQKEINKKFLMYELVIGVISLISFLAIVFAAAYATEILEWQIGLGITAAVILSIGVIFGIKIEAEAGFYECQNCKHRYVPKYLSVFFASHIGWTRYMKCPECNKRTWQKKKLTEREE